MLYLVKVAGVRLKERDKKMNKFKLRFWVLRILSLTLIIGSLFVLVFPFYSNFIKPILGVTVSFNMKDTSQYNWFIKHEKVKKKTLKSHN